ncbi:MAG: energy-coupling factor transporter transmembrane component T family protein [Elusimicrobiota bacterium]
MDIARRFLLGRYIPGKSALHLIDGRVKIAAMILISISIFMAAALIQIAFPLAFFALVFPFSSMRISSLLKGIVPVIWLAGFTAFAHALIPPGDLNTALLMSLKIIILFLWATLLTATTSASELASTLAWFSRPLKFTGLSPEKASLSFSIALRFFPLALEEAESIIKAQRIREEKIKLLSRLEAFTTAFMIRMLNKAGAIDDALKSRRIIEDGKFSYADMPCLAFADYIALMCALMVFVASLIVQT